MLISAEMSKKRDCKSITEETTSSGYKRGSLLRHKELHDVVCCFISQMNNEQYDKVNYHYSPAPVEKC